MPRKVTLTTEKIGALLKAVRDECLEGSFWQLILFMYMLISSIALIFSAIQIETVDLIGILALIALGWISYLILALNAPGSWLLATFLSGGNEHLFAKKHTGTGRVIAKYHTSSYSETIKALKDTAAHWPYGGYYEGGETFLIIEIHHDRQRLRSGLRVTTSTYQFAQPEQAVPIRYQLARGPDGPGAPAFMWIDRRITK